jgi:hypothetical protein
MKQSILVTAAAAILALTGIEVKSQTLVSGFMQGAGNTSVAVTWSGESYDEYYVGTNRTDNPMLGTIRTSSVSVFAAGGITDWADVIVMLPWVQASSTAAFWETIGGMQDYAAALRFRPLQVSLDSTIALDVMVSGGISGPLTNYINNAPVTIGHGSTNLDARLTLQARETSSGLFAMVQTGYVQRSNVTIDRGFDVAVPDAIESVFRLGWTGNPIYAEAFLHSHVAQSGTDIGAGVPFPTNRQTFMRFGGTLAWQLPWVDRLSLLAGGATLLSGSNVGHATRITFGFAYGMPSWGGISL